MTLAETDPKVEQPNPPEEEKTPPKAEDLDKLKSSYDKQIADLKDQLSAAQRSIEENESQRRQNRVLASIEEELGKIDPESPEASKLYASLVREYGEALSRSQQTLAVNSNYAREQAASAQAWKLVNEFGGDFEAYRSELSKAKNQEDLETKTERLALRLERENKTKPTGETRTPQVDGGRGNAVTSSVLDEMKNIDVTTPDGQAEWQKRQGEIKKKIEALAR